MARVVDSHAHFRVADHVEVVLAEIRRHHARHQRLDLGDRFVIHRRVHGDGAGCHARAAADDQHSARMLRDERRQVAEHPLQAHVLRLARRLHLARVVIVADAVGQLGHGDRGVQPLADVDDVGLAHAGRRVAAVRDEQARQRVHAPCEQARRDHRDRQHDRRTDVPSFGVRRIAGARVRRLEHQQRRQRRRDDDDLLGVRAANPRDEHEAGQERADDRADRVRGVYAAREAAGVLLRGGRGGERQRKARAPEHRARQHDPQTADEIELQREPRGRRDRGIDRPVRQRLGQLVRGPRDGAAQQELAPAERAAWRRDAARELRADRAADAQADEEHREDQCERVNRRAEMQRQQPRPDHLRGQRRQPRQRDRHVDRPRARTHAGRARLRRIRLVRCSSG